MLSYKKILKGGMFLFSSERTTTPLIQEKVSIEIQMILWGLIEERKKFYSDLEFLQQFELSVVLNNEGNYIQRINHKQENPFYEKCFYFQLTTSEFFSGTVWIIDNECYSTMLFPKEY